MRRTVLTAAVSGMAIAAGAAGWARGLGRNHADSRARLAQALGLTQDQQEQIANLQTILETTNAPLRQQLQSKREELRALWIAVFPSRDTILAKEAEIDRVRDNMEPARVDFSLAVLHLLTPDQRAKALSMMSARGLAGPRDVISFGVD